MNTDIHNNDDQYRQAFERLEEEPSADVWNKIAADLDNRDAKYYQQKSVRWKRTSLLLLIMLGLVTTTGIVYLGQKQSGFRILSKKENLNKAVLVDSANNYISTMESHTITNNSNQEKNDATREAAVDKSESNSSIPFTNQKQLDHAFEPDYTEPGKQHPEQVQNSTVNSVASNIQSGTSVTKKLFNHGNGQQLDSGKNDLFEKRVNADFHRDDKRHINNRNLHPKEFSNEFHITEDEITNSSIARDNFAEKPRDQGFLSTLKTASNVSSSEHQPTALQLVDSSVINRLNSLATLPEKNIEDADAFGANAAIKKHITLPKTSKPRIEFTVYSSLDFTQYTLDDDEHENNNQPQQHREDKHEIEERESHGFSFSAGLTARLHITPKVSLKTGLIYANSSINIQPQTLYAARDGSLSGVAYKFVTSSGYAYVKPGSGVSLAVGDSTNANSSHQDLQYVSIPLSFGYTIYSGKRFTIVPSLGAAANILLGARVETEINAAPVKQAVIIDKFNGLQSWYPSLMADAELQYHLKRNFSITLLPSFRYAFSPITQNSSVRTFPYSLGLGVGCTYHFK